MADGKYWDEELETLSRSDLENYQLGQLREHLDFAYSRSPYYEQAFDSAGVKPSDLRGLDDIQRFPFTNKQVERERQEASPDMGDMLAVAENEVVFVAASSGSTGVPTLSPFTAQDFDEFQDVQARLFWAAGMRPHDRYVHALNFTLFVGGPNVVGAQRLGALCIWAGTVPSERLLFILKEFKPTITWTTPSYAWHLGETARKEGIDPARDLAISRIIVAGEPGGSIPATRAAIEELWDAELYDFYGLSDIFGANAGMCEARDGLHIAEDHTLVEVLDPVTGDPVPDGEQGELVLTTLRKQARPMIRFRTGDFVTVRRDGCPCGRTHARMEVQGRLDDMFIVSGVNVFPSDIEYVVRNMEELNGEYQVIVYEDEHLTKFDIEVELNAGYVANREEVASQISDRVKTRAGVRPQRINFVDEGTIPRSTHKAMRLVDRREGIYG